MSRPPSAPQVVALAGGVGGARLVEGLDQVLPAGALTVVVNTGDDFEHWGLHISPDLDTVMYTLAGLAPEDRGWGIEGDTFRCLEEAARRGDPAWFQLGDRDLITHITRSHALRDGRPLTEVTSMLCKGLEVDRKILPMCDEPRPTVIVTSDGERLAFQDWLVRDRAKPVVREVRHEGTTEPSPAVIDALEAADVVVVCPSNPFVSIDPIVTLGGIREILRRKHTFAVSPILAGKAVKGPLASMIAQLHGGTASAAWIARYYADFLDGFVLQPGDAFPTTLRTLETNILIQARRDRVALARELLVFVGRRL